MERSIAKIFQFVNIVYTSIVIAIKIVVVRLYHLLPRKKKKKKNEDDKPIKTIYITNLYITSLPFRNAIYSLFHDTKIRI